MPCEIGKAGKPFTKRVVHRPRVEEPSRNCTFGCAVSSFSSSSVRRHLRLKVLAVGRDLDAGQHDLVHARVSQPCRLLERLLDRQKAHPPSRIRNDAVGAEVVAAVLDLAAARACGHAGYRRAESQSRCPRSHAPAACPLTACSL